MNYLLLYFIIFLIYCSSILSLEDTGIPNDNHYSTSTSTSNSNIEDVDELQALEEMKLQQLEEENQDNEVLIGSISIESTNESSEQIKAKKTEIDDQDQWIRRTRPGMSSTSALKDKTNSIHSNDLFMKKTRDTHLSSSSPTITTTTNSFQTKPKDLTRESQSKQSIEQVIARFEQMEKEKDVQTNEIILRYQRYNISRQYAYPIELIISQYESNAYSLYDILQLSSSSYDINEDIIDTSILKKQYRSLALIIHPDKNPHPDAKQAFDYLQEAYDTLSSLVLRQRYNEYYKKIKKQQMMTWKKYKRCIKDMIVNTQAQWQLTKMEMKDKSLISIVFGLVQQHVIQVIKEKRREVIHLLQHFSLLDVKNKVMLYHELLFLRSRWQRSLGLVIIFTLASLTLPI